ncbi:hypothetical protein CBR_g4855 [Chara braunii]|uniref:Cytochrome P450 n=1 Tax=Chara braunii TaxID=69332 RepID=A0A388KJ50_CHABU|nr:hypothetical protein CBR_g4855 [Chara braunii]|eukprot:GBG70028.1 hypothetical protein CBR_g4855 [Chara braunii]
MRAYMVTRWRSTCGQGSSSSSSSSAAPVAATSPSLGDGSHFGGLASMPGLPLPPHNLTAHVNEMFSGDKPLPFVLIDWARRYGPLFRYYSTRGKPVVVVSDPAMAKEVLIQRFSSFRDRTRKDETSELDTMGLLHSSGKYWTGVRLVLMQYLYSPRLNKFLPLMQRATTAFVTKLYNVPEGDVVKLEEGLLFLAMDVVAEVALGIPFDSQDEWENTPLLRALISDMNSKQDTTRVADNDDQPCCIAFLHKFMSHIPWTAEYTRSLNPKLTMRELKRIVARRWKENNIENKEDLLSFLMKARIEEDSELEKTSRALTNDELAGIVRDIMVAGSTTAASTLVFAITLLCKHPHIKAEVVAEIDRWYEQHASGTVDVSRICDREAPVDHSHKETVQDAAMGLKQEDIQCKFPCLDKVIQETARMYCVSEVIERVCTEDTHLGGYFIPMGTQVHINTYGIHYNPELFLMPEAFRPQRFGRLSSLSLIGIPHNNFQMFPNPINPSLLGFGLGPRRCPGKSFALLEMKVVLIRLLRHFDFRLVSDDSANSRLDIETGPTLRLKGGLPVTVHMRRRSGER